MHKIVEQILDSDDLPSPPGVAMRLLEIYSDPDLGISELVDLLSSDPVVVGRLLEYCNSPLFARSRETTTISQAITLLGLRVVKTLALSFSLTQTSANQDGGFDYDQFWNRSLAIAVIVQALAKRRNSDSDQAFLQGLMLSIGQMGLAHLFPREYAEIVQQHLQSGDDLSKLEKAKWDIDHVEISVALLKEWNFPSAILKGIEVFASKSSLSLIEDPELVQQARAFKLALALADTIFLDVVDKSFFDQKKRFATIWFDISEQEFETFFDSITENWNQQAKLLQFDGSDGINFSQLERKARKGIAFLSLDIQAENEEMRSQNEELQKNALFDSLTGLRNRRAYLQDANAEWERASRLKKDFVVGMVDIDHFKSVNDTYGHAIGDEVLIGVADSLAESARKYDIVYRWGGEEFVILIPECEPVYALGIAERLRQAISNLKFSSEAGAFQVTASFGLAVQDHSAPKRLDVLMQEADKMLYRAKSEGRNRVCAEFRDEVVMNPSSKPVLPQLDKIITPPNSVVD